MRITNKNLYIIIAAILIAIYIPVSVINNANVDVTKDTPDNLIELAGYVVPGAILDRDGEIICQGEDVHKLQYPDDVKEGAFQVWMGTEDMLFTNRTLLGTCAPYLFGAYDDRFDMDSLLHPQETFVGGSVKTSIDKEWTEKANKMIKSHYLTDDGAVISLVISDYTTGEVKVIASSQKYDGSGICTSTLVNELKTGSIAKIADAMICLDIDPAYKDFRMTCTGQKYQIGCTHVHGELGVQEALARSCNSFFIAMMNDCFVKHPEEFQQKVAEMGYGADHRFISPQINYIGSVFSDELNTEQISLSSIGQGVSSATTFSAHLITQAALNGGVLKAPYVIEAASDRDGKPFHDVDRGEDQILCSQKTAEQVLAGLKAITHANGTLSSMADKKLIGKTGTAQRHDGKNNIWFSGTWADSHDCITISIAGVNKDVTSVRAAELAYKILKAKENQ